MFGNPLQPDRTGERRVPTKSTREIEVKGKMEGRTGWRGQNESQIEVTDLLVLPRPAKSVQNGEGFSGKI